MSENEIEFGDDLELEDEMEAEDPSEVISNARREFERCQSAEADNRRTALEDIKFARLGEQWPDDVAAKRMADQRPILTINKLPAFIRQVVNDARQNKPSVQVHPVDSRADPETAQVYAGLIRNIESVSNADVAYDTASEQAVTGGFGYWRVCVDYAFDDAFELDILIQRITNQFSVYGDPNSTAADSSDWDVAFVTDRLSKADFKRKYKGKADVSFDSDGWKNAGSDWLNDDGVLIAEWWRRKEVEREIVQFDDGRIYSVEDIEGNIDIQNAIQAAEITITSRRKIKAKVVTQTIISGVDVLQEEKEFPCRYIPIVPVYGDEIIVEGKRYFRGLIHSAKDAQRMFNYWRSTATELVALAPRMPFIGPEEAFSGDDGWSTVNTESHPYLTYKGMTAPMRQPLDSGPAGGALQEAMNASDDMKAIIGMYDASLGARSNETSGRAIMARQREGDVSTFHFVDNLTRGIRQTGNILIDMIPKVYTGERIIRILGEDGKAKTVPINQQFPATDEDGNPIQEAVGVDEEGKEILETVLAMHDLSVGKYDVTVKAGPSFTSQREEAVTQMTALVQAFPSAAPLIADLMASNFDWPQADEVAKRFKELREKQENPMGQIPPEIQQQMEQGKQIIGELQAENEKLKTDQANDQMQAQIDVQKNQLEAQKLEIERMKAQTAAFEAETERMRTQAELAKAQAEAMAFRMQQQPVFVQQ